MIFGAEMAKLIRQSKKTQTRRVATSTSCRYLVGKSYAVQPGRAKQGICRITVMAVRDERLGDINLKDVRREGFGTTEEFFDYWRELHGAPDLDQRVWVISFVLGDQTDTPRLLARRPGAPHGDYVAQPHLAMDGEPEAVSEAETELYAKLGHARYSDRTRDPLLREVDEIRRALERTREVLSERPNALIARQVRQLEQQLRTLDRKIKEAA